MEHPQTTPVDVTAWRQWLQIHHATAKGVWLVYYKKASKQPTITYSDAVEEALCWGWIDSKTQSLDADRYRQLFTPRKANSVWSKVNKAKVERLMATGRMQPSGLAVMERAMNNGSWTILDAVEALQQPPDLVAAFAQAPAAAAFFEQLSRTDQRNLLQWLTLARRADTRSSRIHTLVQEALQGRKPKGY